MDIAAIEHAEQAATNQSRMCLSINRCIDKAGGLDAYILNTPDEKMGSDVGASLREEMLAAGLVPPPQRASRQAQAGGQQLAARQPSAAEPG